MSNMKIHKKGYKRAIATLLCAAMCIIELSHLPVGADCAYAATTTRLRLATAKSLAVANSEKIESIEMQIDAKKAAQTSAIQSLRERERSMSTFRWSPLLNFKFPSTPNEAEAFEFQFKPTQLEYNVKTLEHKLTDQKLSEYESVSTTYIDIITSTAEITFLEQRIKTLSATVLKNQARVTAGLATEEQVKQQQKTLDGLKNELASEKKTLLRAKEKMGKLIGFSVTSGYTFDDEFISTSMDAETVESLAAYAIDKDQTVYEAEQEMKLNDLALEVNYNLMSSKYGGNMKMISGYIEQIQNGSSVNKRAFKKDYDAFLKKIDEPWTGSWKILFFSFPKEWLKGDLDGVRYIEDDPYVLYSAALDYQASVKEYENACEELENTVSDSYDSMMEARDVYLIAKDDLAEQKSTLLEAEAKNAIGSLSLDEYETILEEYESARSTLNDALSTYSKALFALDRTTCGAASAYFATESLTTTAGSAGLGTPGEKDTTEDELNKMSAVIEKGATYSIRSIVSKEEFILYIDVPEDFEYNITDYELWADNRQIGSRTSKDDSIRHLKISVQEVDNVFIRLYNGNEFIDDCAIDPTASYGPLNITVGYDADEIDSRPVIGTYSVEDDTNIDMIRIRYTLDQSAIHQEYGTSSDASYYNMAAEKSLYLFTNDLVSVDDAFTYMSFIRNDLGKLTLRLFAADGTYIGGAKLDPSTGNLYVDSEVTDEDMQRMAARQVVIQDKAKELTEERQRMLDMYNAAKSTNSSETDTAAMTYYKQRIEELDQEIELVSSQVTDEEIDAVLSTRLSEVQEMLTTMMSGEETDESGLTAEEVAARDTILTEAAKDIIKQKRAEEMVSEIDATIKEKKKEILQKTLEMAQLEKNGASRSVIDNLKKEIENLEAEIDSYESKKELVTGDERGISDEEIAEALLKYGDEIYQAASSQLTDAMLYGSATGQWAIAYLESEGLETTPENMREVVSKADVMQKIDGLNYRKDVLKAEVEKVKNTIAKLEENGSNADKSCAAQLSSVLAAYEKEIKSVNIQIKKLDPLKEAKIAKLEEEKSAYEEELSIYELLLKLANRIIDCKELLKLVDKMNEYQAEIDQLNEKDGFNIYTSIDIAINQAKINKLKTKISAKEAKIGVSSDEAQATIDSAINEITYNVTEYSLSEEYLIKDDNYSDVQKKCEDYVSELKSKIAEIEEEISEYL